MISYFTIFIGAVFVNNIILTQFFGICPFMGVSKRISTALGMGMAVMFVMTLSTLITHILYYSYLKPNGLDFMMTVSFILVIASTVQMVEIIVKKTSPILYQALGIFLPLITTNCAVLGIAIITIQKNYTLMASLWYAFSSAVGFTLATVIFAGIRERMALNQIPQSLQGTPIALITAGLISMAFMGFAGIIH